MAPAYPHLVSRTPAVLNILMRLLVAKCIMDRCSPPWRLLPPWVRFFPPSRPDAFSCSQTPLLAPRSGSGLRTPLGCKSRFFPWVRGGADGRIHLSTRLCHVPVLPFSRLRSGGWIKDLPEQAYSRSTPPFSRRDRGCKFRVFSAVGPLLPTLGAQFSTFTIFQTPVLAPRPGVWIIVSSPPFFALRSGVWIKDLPEQAYSRSRPPLLAQRSGIKISWIFSCRSASSHLGCAAFHLHDIPDPRSRPETGGLDYRLQSPLFRIEIRGLD